MTTFPCYAFQWQFHTHLFVRVTDPMRPPREVGASEHLPRMCSEEEHGDQLPQPRPRPRGREPRGQAGVTAVTTTAGRAATGWGRELQAGFWAVERAACGPSGFFGREEPPFLREGPEEGGCQVPLGLWSPGRGAPAPPRQDPGHGDAHGEL